MHRWPKRVFGSLRFAIPNKFDVPVLEAEGNEIRPTS